MRRVRREKQAVAVGRGLPQRFGADEAGAAGPVVDDDRLPEHGAHLFREQPCVDVARAARRKGHDETDGTRRVRLRERVRRNAADEDRGEYGNTRPQHGKPFCSGAGSR
jgi:hypothetical protein